MRRGSVLVLVLLLGAVGLVAAGCGGAETKTATPETTVGSVPSQTTTTQTTTTTTTGGAPQGNPTAGKAVFTGSSGCVGCHTLADAGSTGTVGPNLDQVKPTYDRVVTQVTNGGGAMPPFKGTLTPQQIQDVAAYISSVAGK
jgi:mono/diheme cytochrome c family protein